MLKEKLEKIIQHLKGELAKFQAGRASIDLIENIEVEAYNSKMPLNQLATLSIPEARLILIKPWDKTIIRNIESALRSAMPDINPVVDGDSIRISYPAPTEERRRELAKEAGKAVEEAMIKIRQVREEAISELRDKEEKKEISEDELFRRKSEVQKTIDEYNQNAEEMRQKKEKEIITI